MYKQQLLTFKVKNKKAQQWSPDFFATEEIQCNSDVAYITSVFLLAVRMPTGNRPWKVCSSQGSSPGVDPFQSLKLFGLKVPNFKVYRLQSGYVKL